MTDEELIKLWKEDIKEQHLQDATYLSPGVYVREIDYSPEIPPFEIQTGTIHARTNRLRARWTIEAHQDLAAMHNIDLEEPEINIHREQNENGTVTYEASYGDLRVRRVLVTHAFRDENWDIERQVREEICREIRDARRANLERQLTDEMAHMITEEVDREILGRIHQGHRF